MQTDKKFSMHVTHEDHEKIQKLRKEYGINMSFYFRECMRKLYEETVKKKGD